MEITPYNHHCEDSFLPSVFGPQIKTAGFNRAFALIQSVQAKGGRRCRRQNLCIVRDANYSPPFAKCALHRAATALMTPERPICDKPRHERANPRKASHEVPFVGDLHGRERSRSPTHPTRSQPLQLRPQRSRERSEATESAQRRALPRFSFANPLPRSATFSASLSASAKRAARHRAHSE